MYNKFNSKVIQSMDAHEIIPHTLDLAFLPCPPPVKSGVVALVSSPQRNTQFDLLSNNKMETPNFVWKDKKRYVKKLLAMNKNVHLCKRCG
jgi:hypothetical protein